MTNFKPGRKYRVTLTLNDTAYPNPNPKLNQQIKRNKQTIQMKKCNRNHIVDYVDEMEPGATVIRVK